MFQLNWNRKLLNYISCVLLEIVGVISWHFSLCLFIPADQLFTDGLRWNRWKKSTSPTWCVATPKPILKQPIHWQSNAVIVLVTWQPVLCARCHASPTTVYSVTPVLEFPTQLSHKMHSSSCC